MKEALNNENVIIEAPTGTGKTIMGIEILKRFNPHTTLIVVNTLHLKTQWEQVLGSILQDKSKIIVITTIQSAHKYNGVIFDMLICDESHHIFSEQWLKLLANNKFKKMILLTATLRRDDNRHEFAKKYNFKIIKNMTHNIALKENLISSYEVKNIPVNLTQEESENLHKVLNFIKDNYNKFNYNFDIVKSQIMKNSLAAELMRCFQKRKIILNNAYNKKYLVFDILLNNTFNKALIYCEFIEQADEINKYLKSMSYESNVYHSKTKNKKQILQDFKNDYFDILVTVKALDEGADIPAVDLGIIVSASSQPRQTIQRIGRQLRYQEGKIAKIYNLYVAGSKEEEWMKKRMVNINESTK